jgi:dTDP-4-dehydrorhamnose reductase
VKCRSQAELDVTDAEAVAATLAEVRPDIVLNCAAYTNVDGAESDRDAAFAVNAAAPGIIGRAAVSGLTSHASRLSAAAAPVTPHASGSMPLVVHFSTDYVFSGDTARPYREGDPAGPTGVYAESKLAGERALAESGARYVVIRTSWLFGVSGKSFPRAMWDRAKARQPTRVVNDQVGRPTYTRDLAAAVWRLVTEIGNRESGIGVVHIANSGATTWFNVARPIFAAAGVPELVTPCTTAEYPTRARRPAYSVLDTTRYETLTGAPLPDWRDALDRFLAELS